ncbi:unnamed protein product, partial [Allacma fusca]
SDIDLQFPIQMILLISFGRVDEITAKYFLHQRFDIQDKFMVACLSGKLNLAKFQELYTVVFPCGNLHVSLNSCLIAFSCFEENRDRKIDFQELLCALSLEVLYELYGRETLEAFNMISEALARNLLSTMDLNNDGKISLEEFRVAVKEME